jgi:uncharacterized membrane protein
MMRYGNAGGWGWAFGGAIMLGVLVLIAVAVWAMITVTKHRAQVGGEPVTGLDSAGGARTRQILDERYAPRRAEHRGLHRARAHTRTLTISARERQSCRPGSRHRTRMPEPGRRSRIDVRARNSRPGVTAGQQCHKTARVPADGSRGPAIGVGTLTQNRAH